MLLKLFWSLLMLGLTGLGTRFIAASFQLLMIVLGNLYIYMMNLSRP